MIVSRKFRDDWEIYKLTIKHADGWCAWVTEPSAVETQVGDNVRLTVTLTPSDRDPKFAFGKNPRPFTIINDEL